MYTASVALAELFVWAHNRPDPARLLGGIDELVFADFGFETTLSGRSYVKLLSDMRASGYRVVLFFLWLPNADMAVARVQNRVKQGGHKVPEDDIRRRYAAGVRNLFRLYRPITDGSWLYDASRLPPKLVASEEQRHLTVKQKRLYRRIEKQAEESHEEG